MAKFRKIPKGTIIENMANHLTKNNNSMKC